MRWKFPSADRANPVHDTGDGAELIRSCWAASNVSLILHLTIIRLKPAGACHVELLAPATERFLNTAALSGLPTGKLYDAVFAARSSS